MAAACERARGSPDNRFDAGSAPLDRRNRRVLVVRTKKNGTPEEADAGQRWGCLVQDRPSRFIAARATGRIGDDLVEQAVTLTVSRTQGRALTWCSDGWRGYAAILTRAYRQPVRSGKPGRPQLRVPAHVRLTQTIKHRDEHGKLLSAQIRAVLGEMVSEPGTVHIERVNGTLRDRLNALTRKTHAFAKRDATWDALVSLQLFDHNFHRPHQALRLPFEQGVRRYRQQSPAMALGLTDHLWSFQGLLTSRIPTTL
jgi:hypothetical protein